MATTDSASRRQVIVRGLGIALLASIVLSALGVAGAFEALDLRLLDWRFQLRGERRASDAITIVGVDDPTIRALGGWPMNRDLYAALLTALEDSGARAIGVDLQFPEDVNQRPKWNHFLADRTGRYGNVSQAIWFHADGGGSLKPEAEAILRSHSLPAGRSPAPLAAGISLPFPELLSSAHALGHITTSVDRDGLIRRLPMWIRYQDRIYPSLALRMYTTYRGWSSPERVEWSGRSAIVHWPGGDRSRLPVDHDGSTAIDFAGGAGAFTGVHSMLDVLQWYKAGDSLRLREAFAGRIALIGITATREASEDLGTTPFAATAPLLYLHANAVDNLLRDRFLMRPPSWLHVAGLLVAGVVMGWAFSILPMPRAAMVMAFAVLAVAGIDQLLLAAFAIDVPPTAALALAPIIYASIGTHRFLFLEKRSRQRESDIREGRSVQQRFLPEALVGQRLSHYEIVEKIGGGGMGVVYRGRDLRLARDVAVKVLTGTSLADESMRRRFRREALALSRLNHPHIATVFDFDSQDGVDFLVMELVPGIALSEALARGPLSESKALTLAIQVAEALEAAHARGVLHRDLKPANIVITPEDKAMVLDFGVAKMLDRESTSISANLTESGGMVGTLAYMAPELLIGDPADVRADIWGLGMILFEMTTGVRPFPDDHPHELMYTILNQAPAEPRVLNSKISAAVQAIILRALEKAPGDRFANAGEMLVGLREATALCLSGGTDVRMAR